MFLVRFKMRVFVNLESLLRLHTMNASTSKTLLTFWCRVARKRTDYIVSVDVMHTESPQCRKKL